MPDIDITDIIDRSSWGLVLAHAMFAAVGGLVWVLLVVLLVLLIVAVASRLR